jgi:hypothetical protein
VRRDKMISSRSGAGSPADCVNGRFLLDEREKEWACPTSSRRRGGHHRRTQQSGMAVRVAGVRAAH